MSDESPPGRSFLERLDEAELVEQIVKAYHRARAAGETEGPVMVALRELLSGSPLALPQPDSYRFEDDPERLLGDFFSRLEALSPGLARSVYDPLFEAIEARNRPEDQPRVGVWVGARTGPLALESGRDEGELAAILAAALLTLTRTDPERVLALLPPRAFE